MGNYNLVKLKEDFENGKPLDFIFFWGHAKSEYGVTKTCFSQWYPSSFSIGGDKYSCAEQYMMAEKARLFNDHETLGKIMATNKKSEVKYLGRQVKNFNAELWDNVKCDVVINGNIAKFSQNEELKSFLLNTGDSIIVEASPYDCIWGIGCSSNNLTEEMLENPHNWKGLNLLGFALMEVRDTIRKGL